jgi:hypothetical protein
VSEPWVPEPPPQGPEWETRWVPLCPICKGLVRRQLDGAVDRPGPWACDLHGTIREPEYEELEIPTRYAGSDV